MPNLVTGTGVPADQGLATSRGCLRTFHQPWLPTSSQSQIQCTQRLRLSRKEQYWCSLIACSGHCCIISRIPPQRGSKAWWLSVASTAQLSGLKSCLCHSNPESLIKLLNLSASVSPMQNGDNKSSYLIGLFSRSSE